jgi:protein kinase-like protein
VFLVDVPGEPPRVKLLDFGLAKLAHEEHHLELTATGAMVGTPQYIAPEQAKGYGIDARADIYSLGGVAFELLTGRPPFVADNAMEVVAMHLMEKPQPPSTYAPGLPPLLDHTILRTLAKDREHRPSLDELCFVLDRVRTESPSRPVPAAPAASAPVAPAAAGASDLPIAVASAPVQARPRASSGAVTDEIAVPRVGRARWPIIAVGAVLCVGLALALVFVLRDGDTNNPGDDNTASGSSPIDLPSQMPDRAASAPAPPLLPDPSESAHAPSLVPDRPASALAPPPPRPRADEIVTRPTIAPPKKPSEVVVAKKRPLADKKPEIKRVTEKKPELAPAEIKRAAEKKPDPPPADGKLELVLQRNRGRVTIDGKPYGSIATKTFGLTPGVHSVIVRFPDQDPISFDVTIAPGEAVHRELKALVGEDGLMDKGSVKRGNR